MEPPTPLQVSFWLWLLLIAFWYVAAIFTHKDKSRENHLLRLQHVIPLLASFYLIFSRHWIFLLWGKMYPTGWNRWIVYPGLLATVGGLAFALWSRIHLGRYWSGNITIKEGHRVIRTGPYAMVRHPLYTGWLIATFGSALVSGTADAFFGLELVILAFAIKLQREERVLVRELGDEYRRYMHDIPAALLPGVKTIGASPREIHSEAFNQAILRSDKNRAIGFIAVCSVFIIVDILSAIVYPAQFRQHLSAITWWLALACYEGILLAIAFHAQWQGRSIRTWLWIVNTAIECVLPSIALLALTADERIMGPYRALLSSSLLLYPVFIILSILRLSPMLCLVSGISSAGGYLAIYLFTLHVSPHNPHRQLMPARTYLFDDLLLLSAGIVAAFVAQQVRRHVIAALTEAETRRKLDHIEYDLRTARSIQTALLPKTPPTVAGYDIAGFSEPADQTGGDYYDWIELPNGRIMFTIADATGHGIGPALLITACRAYFRALANRDDPLQQITSQVDALLASDVSDGRFITAAVALLDPAKNLLSLYSAGQAPLFFYCASENAVKTCDADQPPLGTGPHLPDSPARTISFSPGDALVLVTDGFYEYRNSQGDLLGADRLTECIRQNHTAPAQDQIAHLRQEIANFSQGAPQADDTTAVIIRRTANFPA